MKVFSLVMKILLALAAVGAIVYVVVNYGDQIVAWFKKTFGSLCCCKNADPAEEEVAEETTEEETPAEEPAAEEDEVVAAEGDFEG